MSKRESKGNMFGARNATKDPREDEDLFFKIIEELQEKIGGIRKKTRGGLSDYARPRPSLRSRRRPGIEVMRFHREVKCDDIEGLNNMISLIRRAVVKKEG